MSRLPAIPGTYIVTHKPTGMYYIGSTVDLYRRSRQHVHQFVNEGGILNAQIQPKDAKKEDLHFDHIPFDDVTEAVDLEKALLRKNVGMDSCLNRSYGNGGLETYSEETRSKQRLAKLGKPRSDEDKAKISLGKSRGVSINGDTYPSVLSAAEALGISKHTLRTRINRTTSSWKEWFFLE